VERTLRLYLKNGAFTNVAPAHSHRMGAVKGGGNKTTERRFRSALVRAGLSGWKVRPKGGIGNPDFLFPAAKLAVFVDGCFWHGCPRCRHVLKRNAGYWTEKIKRNRARDRRTALALRRLGFKILRFWEHELSDTISRCVNRLRKALFTLPIRPPDRRCRPDGRGCVTLPADHKSRGRTPARRLDACPTRR